MTSLDLLKNQNIISSCITKNIQNISCSETFLINCLLYLKDTSKYMANKIKQKIFVHNINTDEIKIVRSSYKFCNYKSKCTYNYDKNKPGCYADHYPHSMVYADCDILIKYINSFDSLNKNQNKEIIRCINTISFVINHMVEELSNLCLYQDRKSHDKFHHIKIINKFNNKNSKKNNI